MSSTTEPRPKILIIGGGGVGTIAAYNLELSGRAVVSMVLRSNFEVVSNQGFSIESCDHGKVQGWRPSGGIMRAIPAYDPSNPDTAFDYIICCTKNIPDVPPTLTDILQPAVVDGQTAIVLLQNGLNIEKPILKAFPRNIVVSGVSLCGAKEEPQGHILHNDHDKILLGPFHNANIPQQDQGHSVKNLLDVYCSSGRVTALYDENVVATRWRKLIFNAVYNPISALTDVDTSRLRLYSSADFGKATNVVDALIRPGMKEVRAVAKAAAGIEFADSLLEQQIESDPIDGFIMPSMQQDVRKRRFIECESILGQVLEEAARVGVAVPILTTLYCLCRTLQTRTMEEQGMIDIKDLLSNYKTR